MSLRYAMLAILRVGPLSGYDLQKQFAQSVGHVWHAPDSQIYPELRRMAVDGLVDAEEQPRGERGVRRIYHVTDAGERAFQDWIDSPLDYQRLRDPAHLRAAYLESASPDRARALFEGHAAQWRSELAVFEGQLRDIESLTNPQIARRMQAIPEEERERALAFKRFAYEGLMAQAETEIAWAERGLRLLAELEAAEGAFRESSAV